MPEEEVIYSDVKFTKAKEKITNTTTSPSAENTYSEINIRDGQPPAETHDSGSGSLSLENCVEIKKGDPKPQVVSEDLGSKVRAERVAVVVLILILTAAVIGLSLSYHYATTENNQTLIRLEKLTLEHEVLKKNFTEWECEEVVQPTCPPPQGLQMGDVCEKRCAEGWVEHGGKCYSFSTTKQNWTSSRSQCQADGADLVKIDSREEQTFIYKKLENYKWSLFWIGLTDSEVEETWKWVDGSVLNPSLAFWQKDGDDEPDNSMGVNEEEGEDCARMGAIRGREDQGWFDQDCRSKEKWICEKDKGNGSVTCV